MKQETHENKELPTESVISTVQNLQTFGRGRGKNVTPIDKGELIPRCKKLNKIYESICAQCNPEAKKKGPLKNYAGEPLVCMWENI